MLQMGFSDVGENNQPKSFQETFEQKREEHRAELQRKEDEMRQSFVLRVKEKETELKEVEKEVRLMVVNCSWLLIIAGSKCLLFYELLVIWKLVIMFVLQLYTKYDQLKREHAEEKKRYEELKKRMEDERQELSRRRAQLAAAPTSHHHTLTLGKSKKKWDNAKLLANTATYHRLPTRDTTGTAQHSYTTCLQNMSGHTQTEEELGLVHSNNFTVDLYESNDYSSEYVNNNTSNKPNILETKDSVRIKHTRKFTIQCPLAKWDTETDGKGRGFQICGLIRMITC